MRALILILMLLLPWQAFAQDSAEQEKSWFTDYVENKLSTPGRQIRISGIEGVLSSNATIGTITVADREGVWLTLEKVAIIWTRSALLRGRLEIGELSAGRVSMARQPLPDDSLPSPEASRFALPELPLAIAIAKLELAEIVLGEAVAGQEARLQAAGNLTLADGSLETRLSALRTDGPGGSLALTASFANESRDLAIDLDLKEPANGLAATLLAIEGKPSLDLTIKGAAPLSNWKGDIALVAGGQPALAGSVTLSEQDAGLAVTAALGGPLAILAPDRLRPFFGPESRLDLSGLAPAEGGFKLDKLQLAGGALRLDASALILPDGFLRALTLDGTLAAAGNGQIPLPGSDTTLSSASLLIDYGGTTDGQWTGRMVAEGIAGPGMSIQRIFADMGGQVSALDDPATRSVTASARMVASGLTASDTGTARALGPQPSADLNVTVRAGQPLEIALLELKGAALLARATGLLAQGRFDGDIALVTESLAPFSGLAGRELAGSANLTAKGKLDMLSGGFDMVLDGKADNISTGDAGLDGLFAGTTRIAGRLARDENGIAADAFSLGNDQARITADGRFSSTDADFAVDGSLSDLALVDERLSGPLALNASLKGSGGVIATKARLAVDEGRLAERRLYGAALALDGTITNGDFSGTVTGDAMLDGERVSLSSAVTHAGRATAFSDLSFATRGAVVKGDVSRDASGLLDGRLVLKAPDISTAAALALLKASGAMDATLDLDPKDGQTLTLEGAITGLAADGFSAARATVKAAVTKLFAVPIVNGSLAGEKIVAGGIDIATLTANAKATGSETAFNTKARLANGSALEASGMLMPADGGYAIALDTASVTNKGQALALEKPARLAVKGSQVTLEPLSLKAGEGRIGAQGKAGDALDLQLTLDRVPLALANMVRGDLGLGGTLGGVVSVTGTSAAPSAEFAFRGQGITAAMLSKAGIEPLAVAADGQMQGQRLAVSGTVTNGQGLAASVSGSAPLGNGSLDLDVVLKAFPLAILNAVQPGAGLGGTIAGRVKVTGPAAKPDLAFALDGTRVSASALVDAGLPPLTLAATGRLARDTVQLDRFTASGEGLNFDARGTVPLSGTGLAVDFKGTVPLSLADGMLADRAAQARGTLSVSGRATGSIERPGLNAMLSATGAEFIDPQSNIRLQRIAFFASISGDQLTLRSFTGGLATGGTVSASGALSLAEGMPANLAIRLENARYSDGQNVAATLSGNLTLTGALMRDPLLAGRILVNRADLTVPEGSAEAVDIAAVKHRKAPESVLRTLERALPRQAGKARSSAGPVLRLNVRVEAPNKIFLRGRGLDTELGGSVTLTGPVSDIQPTGGFEIIRGRLSILAQRITLDSGRVTLIGDLDPYVDLTATTPGKDIAVTIRVTGRVSDLDISFSSQPELPEDEVLSRLIFGRSITDLSPVQLARLAAAASELAGGGPSILDQLREATGLDDLDVVTDDEGNTAARAGRYVSDNVYLGVEAGSKGNSKVTIDLDITDNLKARGSVGSEETGVGVFFEKDY